MPIRRSPTALNTPVHSLVAIAWNRWSRSIGTTGRNQSEQLVAITWYAHAATGRAYSGVNIPILWHAADVCGYETHGWMTFRQANSLGAHIRKGEHGTEVVFALRVAIDWTEGDEEPRTRPILRTYVVFNVDQIAGLPDPVEVEPPATDAQVDAFVAATNAEICSGGDKAVYVPGLDSIAVPPIEAFKDTASYYAVLLHELGHWTGHPIRLDRDLNHRFGSKAYAAEELIAELTAAFLCAHLGIRGELRHAGYIETWISLLKTDNRAIFTAASKASQAADFLKSHHGKSDFSD